MSETKKKIADVEDEVRAQAATMTPGEGEILAKMELALKPDYAKKTGNLSLIATDLPLATASHLLEHVQDAITDWMQCVGGKGFKTTAIGDKDGNVLEQDTEQFGYGDGTDFNKLPVGYDPKKVN